jgi:hypothetical protein
MKIQLTKEDKIVFLNAVCKGYINTEEIPHRIREEIREKINVELPALNEEDFKTLLECEQSRAGKPLKIKIIDIE